MSVSTKGPIVVGFDSLNYGGARNTYAPVDGVVYKKRQRIPCERLGRLRAKGLDTLYVPVQTSRSFKLLHLWNRIPIAGVKDWGVSFESTLPYFSRELYPRSYELMKRRLFSGECKFLIPFSQSTRRVFSAQFSASEMDELEPRVEVVYPHQHHVQRRLPYPPLLNDDPLRMMFVGRDFFRKGGEALLRAVEEVGDELNLHVTIVSAVLGGDYRETPPSEISIEDIHRRINDNPRIDWYISRSNDEVIKLMQGVHVGLLPTLQDTFGYTVLEFMSSGVPTIVTDVESLPEFTGPDTGWVLNVERDELGIWLGRSSDMTVRRSQYYSSVDLLTSQLITTLRGIREKPDQLMALHESSLKRVRTQFDPVARQAKMLEIYRTALDR